MSVSFKDFAQFVDADQISEGAIWDAIKKKLSLSKEEEDSALERLKAKKAGYVAKTKTVQKVKSAAEKARDAAIDKALQDFAKSNKTSKSISHDDARASFGSIDKRGMTNAGQEFHGDVIAEAREFVVTYVLKSNASKQVKTRMTGRDSFDVKRKFADTHYGAKLISITPRPTSSAPSKRDKPEEVEEDLMVESMTLSKSKYYAYSKRNDSLSPAFDNITDAEKYYRKMWREFDKDGSDTHLASGADMLKILKSNKSKIQIHLEEAKKEKPEVTLSNSEFAALGSEPKKYPFKQVFGGKAEGNFSYLTKAQNAEIEKLGGDVVNGFYIHKPTEADVAVVSANDKYFAVLPNGKSKPVTKTWKPSKEDFKS